MNRAINVLLQTTIEPTKDDWSIARFSLLAEFLRSQKDVDGRALFNVTARDRESPKAPDSVLAHLDSSDFDEMWLFATDTGNGLTPEDSAAISRFWRGGGGLMVTRDHMDLGCSVCSLEGIGGAHHFHTHNVDTNSPLERDDSATVTISWPNFHSGANGDYQLIEPVGPLHPVLKDAASAMGRIRFLPAHPHEGAVSAPPGLSARVIATGRSQVTQKHFNLAVAFEKNAEKGRAIAQSTFHHFVDYNWDTRLGAPSFVGEPPGNGICREPAALADTHRYALNVALWLGGVEP